MTAALTGPAYGSALWPLFAQALPGVENLEVPGASQAHHFVRFERLSRAPRQAVAPLRRAVLGDRRGDDSAHAALIAELRKEAGSTR